jgi:signal transduction histidine kinase
VLIFSAAIFTVEGLVMFAVLQSGVELSLFVVLVVAALSTVLLFPLLLLVLYRPLTRASERHRRVEYDLRRSVDTQLSLHRLAGQKLDSLDSEKLLEALVDEVVTLVDADAAWVTVPGGDGTAFSRVVAHRGVPDEVVAAEKVSSLATCPVCGPLLDSGRPSAGLQLLTECPRVTKKDFESAGLTTHVGALVPTGNGRPAILNIGWRHRRRLSSADRALLATLVHQFGIVLDNAHLYRAEQRVRRRAQTLCHASIAVARSLEFETVIEALLVHLAELIPYDRARVMLLEGSARLRVHAMSDGENVSFVDPGSASFDTLDNPIVHRIVSNRCSRIIEDTHRHSDWGKRMEPEFEHSWIGVPLVAGHTVLGLFSLSKAEAGFFNDDHLGLAEALAAPASIAIHNAVLFDRARSSGELLQTLSRQQVEMQEAERRAISRDLHDGAGQVLTTLKVGLRLLERQVGHHDGVSPRVAELLDITDALQDDLHRMASDLRPAILDQLGLIPSLREYLSGIDRQHRQIVEFEAVGLDGIRFPSDLEIALFRITQEAVTNAVRHAKADRVDVLIERRGDRVILLIEDDGIGLDVDDSAGRDRLGLVGMGERTEMLGGTLLIESSFGAGTTVVVEVPCER